MMAIYWQNYKLRESNQIHIDESCTIKWTLQIMIDDQQCGIVYGYRHLWKESRKN